MVNRDDVAAAVGALAGGALGDARELVAVRSSALAGLELVEHEEDDDVAADPAKEQDETLSELLSQKLRESYHLAHFRR